MTHPLPHPISDPVACAQFEERLMAYLEHELNAIDRAWMDGHQERCARCASIVQDLEQLPRSAQALPSLSPSRDLWDGIAARLEATVVPLHGRAALTTSSVGDAPQVADAPAATSDMTVDIAPRIAARAAARGMSARWLAVAATMLVAVSSAVTWRIARTGDGAASDRNTIVATQTDTNISTSVTKVIPTANADEVYEQEIDALRTIVNERFSELDSTTVAVLRNNLAIIDKAIADSRKALEKDPGSRILSTTLDRALHSKLTLMRRVALL